MNTQKTQIVENRELYVSPVREKNIERIGEHENQCECCGKLMKGNDSKVVHMGVDWMAYNTDETIVVDGVEFIQGTEIESQGFFKIGNDCAKKMNGFTFEF